MVTTTPSATPRVVVVGTSCSGKSTFARSLGQARACPVIELDELYWGPDWTPKPAPDFHRLVADAVAAEGWVAAGNYSAVRHVLWSRATTVVWLNYSLPRVFWRGLRRTIARNLSGDEIFHGNRESLRRSFFSRESILLWILNTFHRRRRELEALRASNTFSHVHWLEARHPRDAAAIMRTLQGQVP